VQIVYKEGFLWEELVNRSWESSTEEFICVSCLLGVKPLEDHDQSSFLNSTFTVKILM
jgi:hypothetical protein